jgi:hypothetical protein
MSPILVLLARMFTKSRVRFGQTVAPLRAAQPVRTRNRGARKAPPPAQE